MELVKKKEKNGMKLIIKTWERCRSSIGRRVGAENTPPEVRYASAGIKKSKSWTGPFAAPETDRDEGEKRAASRKWRVAPEGCFSVYVGAQRQRFAVKTEYANHPLFKILLEEAELEYGFTSEGPLALPCNVDFFIKVLVKMDSDQIYHHQRHGCILLSPSKKISFNNF